METTPLSYFAFSQSHRRCFLIYLVTIQWQALILMWYSTRCYLNKVLHLPLIMSAHQKAAKRISLDWSSFGKRVVSIKQNSSVKTTWVKTINKCSHLKVVSPHFLSKSKRKLAKDVYLGKIAAGKITACNFNKKTPSQVPFTVTLFSYFFSIQKLLSSTLTWISPWIQIKACVH